MTILNSLTTPKTCTDTEEFDCQISWIIKKSEACENMQTTMSDLYAKQYHELFSKFLFKHINTTLLILSKERHSSLLAPLALEILINNEKPKLVYGVKLGSFVPFLENSNEFGVCFDQDKLNDLIRYKHKLLIPVLHDIEALRNSQSIIKLIGYPQCDMMIFFNGFRRYK